MTSIGPCRGKLASYLSLAMGLAFVLPLGLPAVVLGVVGLILSRTPKTANKAAIWGLYLGMLSIYLTFHPFGCLLLQPPILSEDRSLQAFLNRMCDHAADCSSESRIHIDGLTEEERGEWCSQVSLRLGRGTVVLALTSFYLTDPGSEYLVYFSDAGFRRLETGAPDHAFAREKGYVLIVPRGQEGLPSPIEWALERRRRTER